MDDCQVEEAVVEVLEAIELQTPIQDMCLDVRIKCLTEYLSDEYELFRLKMSFNGVINITELSRNGQLVCLAQMIYRMQQAEDQSHLYVVIPNAANCSTITKSFLAEQTGKSAYRLICQSSKPKIGTGSKHTAIHIRVYQKREHMMRESKLLHAYLENKYMINPNFRITFKLTVGDSVCYSRFELDETFELTNELKIVSNSTVYIDDNFSPAQNIIQQFKISTPQPRIELDQITKLLNVTAVGFRLDSEEVDEKVSRSTLRGSVSVRIYSLNGVPISINTDNAPEESILAKGICWQKYGFKLTEPDDSRTCLNRCYTQTHRILPLGDRVEQKSRHTQFRLFFLVLLDCGATSMKEKLKFHLYLKSNLSTLMTVPRVWECVRLAMESVLSQILAVSNPEKDKFHSKIIPEITSSLSSIIERSTNGTFVDKCLKLLDVKRLDEVKQKVVNSLQTLAPVQYRDFHAPTLDSTGANDKALSSTQSEIELKTQEALCQVKVTQMDVAAQETSGSKNYHGTLLDQRPILMADGTTPVNEPNGFDLDAELADSEHMFNHKGMFKTRKMAEKDPQSELDIDAVSAADQTHSAHLYSDRFETRKHSELESELDLEVGLSHSQHMFKNAGSWKNQDEGEIQTELDLDAELSYSEHLFQ